MANTVLMTAPDGIILSRLQLRDGTSIQPDSNGVFTVPTANIADMVSMGFGFQTGEFASAAKGSGVAIGPHATKAKGFYADDAGAVLWATGSVSDLRTTLSRLLITKDNTGGNIRAWGLMGQLKSYDGFWNGEQVGAVHGRLEIVRSAATLTLGGNGISAGGAFTVATSGVITVGATHILAGVAAVSDFRATLTQTGKTVGLLVAKYDATNWSDGTTRTVWGYGLYVPAGAVGQAAIQLGDKASAYGSGIAVNAAPADGSGIAGILKVYGDLANTVPGNAVDINAVESRFLVDKDCSAASCSIKAMRGHLRVVGGKLPSGSNAGLIGYLEMSDTSVISTNESAAVMAMVDLSATSGASNNVASAFCACSNGLSLSTARSTVLHCPGASPFTSLMDIGSGSTFVGSNLTGGTPIYLTIYYNNKAYAIKADTTT